MHVLSATFEAGQRRLAANPALPLLADPAICTASKLVVVPTMAFWVLGFGDAMAYLRASAGTTTMDALVTQHAEEDAEHWRWFVADLESLALRGIGTRSMGDALLLQWGPTTEPVRACACGGGGQHIK